VDDSGVVSSLERVGNLRGNGQRLFQRNRAT
jgi:hypothetical protein